MKTQLLPLFVLSCLGVSQAQATPLFADGFESAALGSAPAGWTYSNSAKFTVSSSFASEGAKGLRIDSSGTSRVMTLASPLSLAGAGDVVIHFDYLAEGSFESGDGLTKFEVDLGGGYQTVLTDMGAPDGATVDYTGVALVAASTASLATSAFQGYTITIPETYYTSLSASALSLRFTFVTSVETELVHLDNISVSTSSVPEPSALAVVLGGAVGVFGVMRRRRRLT